MTATGAARRKGAAGFSVLELLVSFVVLAIAMTLASELMLESQARLAHAARQAMDPVADLTLKQIRADVRASTQVAASDHEWNWTPLILTGHPVGAVQYEKIGTDLVRKIAGTAAAPGGQRVVMQHVRVWRWRVSQGVPLPLIEIELAHRVTPRLGLLSAAGRREAPILESRSHRVAVSPRRVAGRSGW